VAYDAVNGLRNKLEEQVQVDLLGLLAVGVEAVFQLHDVDVPQLLHDLRTTALPQACSRTRAARSRACAPRAAGAPETRGS